jgi:hypothetical protein
MKTVFTTTALASLLVVGGMLIPAPAFAQDNQPCVGDNCPAPDMQGGQEVNKKRLKGVDQDSQNSQGADESADQPLKRKKKMQGSVDDNGMGDQTVPRKKRAQGTQQSNDVKVDVDGKAGSKRGMRQADWKFDSNRHQRRRGKDATFRFYLDGYYYAQPYWQVDVVRSGRVSCGEGRAIVSERFNRVRVVECNGATYTYLGRSQGDGYRILLNSRTGRIVGRAPI